jgi:hypothetical protein
LFRVRNATGGCPAGYSSPFDLAKRQIAAVALDRKAPARCTSFARRHCRDHIIFRARTLADIEKTIITHDTEPTFGFRPGVLRLLRQWCALRLRWRWPRWEHQGHIPRRRQYFPGDAALLAGWARKPSHLFWGAYGHAGNPHLVQAPKCEVVTKDSVGGTALPFCVFVVDGMESYDYSGRTINGTWAPGEPDDAATACTRVPT